MLEGRAPHKERDSSTLCTVWRGTNVMLGMHKGHNSKPQNERLPKIYIERERSVILEVWSEL